MRKVLVRSGRPPKPPIVGQIQQQSGPVGLAIVWRHFAWKRSLVTNQRSNQWQLRDGQKLAKNAGFKSAGNVNQVPDTESLKPGSKRKILTEGN